MARLAVLAAIAAAASAKFVPASKLPLSSQRSTAPGVLNVHIVPHTHDDVGWLKTVDEYYYGASNYIQHANVQSIITAMISELIKDTNRRFTYVEQAFFQRWWAEQSDDMKATVRQLVANGQLDFVNGGWCMHDEANPSFVDMIDQTALGHRWLQQEFGFTPKVTWQIDPFGHSGFNAYAMSSPMSGFNSVFFARSDYQDFDNRKNNNATEFYWAPSPSLGDKAATMGGIFPFYYYPPAGLNFGGDDNQAPVMDDPTLEEYNVPAVVANFLTVARQAKNWTLGDVMILAGTDFSYENAVTWYNNLDKVIKYVNVNTSIHGVHAFYSTPTAYATTKIADNTLPSRYDDMMPYADGPHAVWAGYFTSRSALKAYIRETSSYHQAVRQVQLFGAPPADLGPDNPLYLLERAISVAQHHDAVAGTSKQAVAYDYALRLAKGRLASDDMLVSAFASLTGYNTPFVTCDLANATICPATEAIQPTAVLIYNSQAQGRSSMPVRIPVGTPAGVKSYSVVGPNGSAVQAQLIPLSDNDNFLRTGYYNYSSGMPASWLAFFADVPPAGYATYFITPSASAEEATLTHISVPRTIKTGVKPAALKKGRVQDSTLSNGVVTLTISTATGRISGYTNTANGVTVPLSQDFTWYNASSGATAPNDGTGDYSQPSGAYIFRTNSSTNFPTGSGAVSVSVVTGPIVNEAVQVWPGGWISQVVRLWAGSSTVDFEWTVGPIPMADGNGKEVVTRYTTPLQTGATWYTDSNGRDSMKRVRNYRPTWNLTVYEPIADNYFPVNLFQWAKDEASGTTLTVVSDRSNAGSSITDGSLEFLIHRRLTVDDDRGVGEPLSEPGIDYNGTGLVVRGVHRLTLDPASSAGQSRRTNAQHALWRPLITYSPLPASISPSKWISTYKPTFSGLSAALPPQLHLLTAHAWGPSSVLVRLSHSYEAGEDSTLSQPASADLATLFAGHTLSGCTEMTLTANQPLASAPTTTYTTADGKVVTLPYIPTPPAGPGLTVTLGPMDIRTFLCTISSA